MEERERLLSWKPVGMKSLTLANTPRGYIHSPLGQTENGEDLGLSDIDLDVIYDTTASANRESTVKSSPNSFNMRQQRLLINPDPNRRENTCMGWLTQFRKQNPMFYRVTCIILGIIFGLLVVRLIKSSSHNMKHHNNSSSSDFIEDSTSSWTDFQATSPGLGVVATDSATCSQVGVNLLILGGNAVDAAVASALCLGVVSPGSSGMGGGAFILFHNATSKLVEFIDSRETAPAASTSDMFDTEPKLSQDGGLAVGTLAELKGLYQLQRNHGALEWADCTEPAAILAEDYVVSAELANMLSDSDVMPYLFSGDYPEFSKLFLNPDGSVKKELDHVYNTKLSETLRMIGLHGSDYLYKTMAATLASEIQAVGGILQESDIQNYSFVESQPITASIMGHTLYSASGSSSGGAAVAGIAEFMDGFAEPLASEGLVYNHRLVEACKNAFAIRMSLADPAFVNTTGPIAALTSKTYMNALREDMNDAHVLPLYDYGGEYNLDKVRRFLPEDHGTSHLSVIDKHGNAVALTSTVNTYFGSKIVSASTGIVFNNQMVSHCITSLLIISTLLSIVLI